MVFWRCLLGSATIWGNRCMSGDGFALGAHTQSENTWALPKERSVPQQCPGREEGERAGGQGVELGQLSLGPSRFPPSVDWLLQPRVTPALLRVRGHQGCRSAQQLGKRPKWIVYAQSRPSPHCPVHGSGDREATVTMRAFICLISISSSSSEPTPPKKLQSGES